MKKKIVLVCMTICLMVLMTACGRDRLNDATAPEASQTPGVTESTIAPEVTAPPDTGNQNGTTGGTTGGTNGGTGTTTDDVDGTGDNLADDAEDIGEDLKDGAEDVGDALTGDDAKENR